MQYLISHFGIFLFCAFIFIFGFLSSFVQNKNLKYYFFMYILIICVFAYLFDPAPLKCDLDRHFDTLAKLQNLKFNAFLDNLKTENLKGTYILFYLISKTGDFHLLPVVSVLIVYGNLFYILNKEIQINNITGARKSTLILFVVICLNYIATISGIRNYIGLSIFAISTYMDLKLKKNRILSYAGYFVSLMFHESLVALLLVRLFFILFNKKYTFFFFGCLSGLVLFALFNMESISILFEGDYSGILFTKLSYYEDYGTGRLIMVFAIMLNLTLILIQLMNVYNFKQIFKNKYLSLIFFLIIFEMIMPLFSYQIFTRFFNYVLVIFIPVCAIFINKLYDMKNNKYLDILVKFTLLILLGIVYYCYGYSNYVLITL